MTVRVVTDTTASLTPELAAEWDVRLVPLTVVVGGRSYRDTEVDPAQLPPGRATTAGPAPGDFVAALQDAPDGAVVVTVAASLSSTNAAARMAAEVTDAPVEVVDSTSAAGAQALVVLAAADRAAEGAAVRAVADAARAAVHDVRLVGCLDNLDGLARSGRVPGPAAHAVRRTGMRFMFRLRRGRIQPSKPAASEAAAMNRMVRACVRSKSPGLVADLVLLGETTALAARVDRAVSDGRLAVGRRFGGTFGTAITVYTGPHVTGLAWRWRPKIDDGGGARGH